MPGLVPGIHVFVSTRRKDVDGRDKPGHDGAEESVHSICDSPAACGERSDCIGDAIRVRGTGLNARRARRREALHPKRPHDFGILEEYP
ncbi:hypothetical protein XI02_08525 [Bradyrhizobium sp. CCBAU 21365]|nr:hypothetical protein XI02_08525 [Bradyrhizobium sp. CCBAU 21365]